MDDDISLLSRYAKDGTDAAFTELVQRHLGFVYNTALRQVGGAHRAEDVAQAVFTDLARKAAVVARRSDLIGWLHTSTHFAAAKLKRSEQRREIREHAAHTMQALQRESPEIDWEQIRPVLDDALRELPARDREAVLLRYFQVLSFAEIGHRLGLGEDAARMRVDRAVKSLRERLARRGVTSSAGALATALAQQPVMAVPAGLAGGIAAQALASAGTGGLLASVAGLFAIMNTTKTAITVGVVVAALVSGSLLLESGGRRDRDTKGNTEPVVSSPGLRATPGRLTEPAVASAMPVVAAMVAGPAAPSEQEIQQELYERALAERRRRDSVKNAQQQSRGLKQPTLTAAAEISPADRAKLESLVTPEAALAYFNQLTAKQLMMALEHLYALPASASRELRLRALFQSWTSRNAGEAMAAAEKGGIPLEKIAVDAWSRVDLSGAWSWVAASGILRGDYAPALVNGASAGNREEEVAAWLTPLAGAYEMEPAFKELARVWVGKDPAAVGRWLQVLAAGEDQAYLEAVRTSGLSGTVATVIGEAGSGLPVATLAELIQQQNPRLGTRMLVAAAKQWVAGNQLTRLGEFEKFSGPMLPARSDEVLSVVVVGIVRDDPDYALQLAARVTDPWTKTLALNQAWTALLSSPGKEREAIRFALATPDDQRADSVAAVYRKWKAIQPEQARAYLDRASLPADLRAKLEAL